MTGVSAVHDALRHVDPAAGDVGPIIHIRYGTDGAAVNAHTHPQIGTTFQGPGYFQRALHWRIRRRRKNQRHAITGWNTGELTCRFGGSERLGAAHNLVQFLQRLALLVDEQLRVIDDVDE